MRSIALVPVTSYRFTSFPVIFLCNIVQKVQNYVFTIMVALPLNILQLDGEKRDNTWGVFDDEESKKHLSLSLESMFHHCCLEKETDAELLHRDLSTALLLQIIRQKDLLDKGQKDVIEKMKTKEADICKKKDLEASLGRVFW